MRAEWISAVQGTIKNYRAAAENPGDRYGHIASEKLAKIVTQCNELDCWLDLMQGQQNLKAKSEKPVLICAEMERKNQELAAMADVILKEPKPAGSKEAKKVPEEKQEGDEEAKDNGNNNDDQEDGEEEEAEDDTAETGGETAEKAAEPSPDAAANMDVD